MMKNARVTLDDIAQKVGVSKMTVSRYIKNPSSVAKETGRNIKAMIDELGYVPNRAPVMLTQAATNTIGLAVSSFSNLLFSELIDGVEERAREYGFDVLISHTSYKEEKEERKIMQLLSYQVDALILTEPFHTPATLKRLHMAQIPVVELMSLIDHPIDMNIGYDHVKVSYGAIKGLIQSGRKNIAYLRSRLDSRTMDRQYGYEIACHEAHLPTYIFGSDVPSNFSRGATMMRQALKEVPDLDAIYCTNDDVAIGAMIACSEMGIKIPEQIAVLGYNGLDIGTATIPKLSSIVTARKEMGRMAVDLIMRRLHNETLNQQRIELYPMLSLGETLNPQERATLSRIFDTLYAIKLPKLKIPYPAVPSLGSMEYSSSSANGGSNSAAAGQNGSAVGSKAAAHNKRGHNAASAPLNYSAYERSNVPDSDFPEEEMPPLEAESQVVPAPAPTTTTRAKAKKRH